MDQNYRVGIVVLNWKNAASTIECVASLLESTYSNFHIVAVDNHSDDDSLSVLRKAYGQHPKVDILATERNGGYAFGNNRAIEHLQHQPDFSHFWILNNDVVVKPDTLSAFVKHAEANPNEEILGCTALNPDGTVQGIGGGRLSRLSGRIIVNMGKQSPSEWDYVAGSCLFMSKEAWSNHGPLPEHYFMYWEDIDFCVKAKKAGVTFGLVPTEIIHNDGLGWKGDETKKMRQFVSSGRKFFNKHPNYPLWRLYLLYVWLR